ncbi:MAG: GNAT family N-acetyltransferase [Hyphomonadaceae bacterium]|nr:GNAT family N-acetyltransferase [Hyphomonadaceae bacterium]
MDEIKDNDAARRFELAEPGGVSFATYARSGDVVTILHVETPAALRGRGAAARLMAGVAARARADGFRIRPVCSYAVAWFARHRDEGDVLA